MNRYKNKTEHLTKIFLEENLQYKTCSAYAQSMRKFSKLKYQQNSKDKNQKFSTSYAYGPTRF
jgi:hypothetical protein